MVVRDMTKRYTPSKGDLIWIDFNPQVGKEIMKRRPALVLSPKEYNTHGLALVVPIRSRAKSYPFEVKTENVNVRGVILADSIKSLDWQGRNAKFIDTVSKNKLNEVLELLSVLLEP